MADVKQSNRRWALMTIETIPFEEEYEDVLQNIEFALLSMVNDHPKLCDYDMLAVIEHSLTYYKSQQNEGTSLPQGKLDSPLQEIFKRVVSMCDWRLGVISPPSDIEMTFKRVSREELILCLKRIEKSIKFWTKVSGRRGYITFAASRALV